MLYIVEEYVNLYEKMGVAVGFDSSSSINGSYELLGCESLPISHIHLIEDEAPRFRHIACEEESSRNLVRAIGNRRPRYRYVSI